MKLIGKRNELGNIEITGGEDIDKYHNVRRGIEISIELRQTRNINFHSKFWKLLHITFDNMPDEWQEKIQSPSRLLEEIKISLGLFETYFSKDGKEIIRLGSISFAKMDEAKFSAFYNKSVQIILDNFITGDNEAFRHEVAIHF